MKMVYIMLKNYCILWNTLRQQSRHCHYLCFQASQPFFFCLQFFLLFFDLFFTCHQFHILNFNFVTVIHSFLSVWLLQTRKWSHLQSAVFSLSCPRCIHVGTMIKTVTIIAEQSTSFKVTWSRAGKTQSTHMVDTSSLKIAHPVRLAGKLDAIKSKSI